MFVGIEINLPHLLSKIMNFFVIEQYLVSSSKCPSLITIFFHLTGHRVERALHLLRVSRNRPNFWFHDMICRAAQSDHVSSIVTSEYRKGPYLVSTEYVVRLLNSPFSRRFSPAAHLVDKHSHTWESFCRSGCWTHLINCVVYRASVTVPLGLSNS